MLDMAQVESLLERLPIRDRQTRRLVPFRFNPNQFKIHQKAIDLQRRRRPIRFIVLKARRVGISSYTEGVGICHCAENSGAKGLIVAHQFKSSKGLFEVPLTLVTKALSGKASLSDLMGLPKPNKHSITIPHRDGEATLEIATAGSVESGRGLSNSFLHLSEAAFYGGLESFASLLPTVPRDPGTFIVIESTANGRVGPGEHFYDYWENSVSGQTEYVPIFIPWMDDPNCTADPMIAADAPCDDEERDLIKTHGCTKSQLAWRRLTIETECKGYLPLFHQEYPATAEEAFISTGNPVFEKDEIAYAKSCVRPPMFIGRLEREGNIIRPFPSGGELHVWELPRLGNWYYIGADAAVGTREAGEKVDPDELGDFASITVWNGSTGAQAARLALRINPETLADWCDRLGRWYNKAMVAIELTGNLGRWAQAVLRDRYRYPNFYRWRGRDDKLRAQKPPTAIGWDTTMSTRPMMMDSYRAAIRERRCIPRDEALVHQMDSCERSDDFRWQIKRGHDDILMAAMIGWICLEQWAPPRMGLGGKSPMADPEVAENALLQNISWRNDIEAAAAAHHESIMKSIRNPSATTAGKDRLEGI